LSQLTSVHAIRSVSLLVSVNECTRNKVGQN